MPTFASSGRQSVMLDPESRQELLTAGPMLEEVAQRHLVTVAEMKGQSRLRPFVDARREAIWQLYRQGLAITQIARIMRRDHSTILYHLRDGGRF
jgi:chromosomal replication initiation ATPase DnaA